VSMIYVNSFGIDTDTRAVNCVGIDLGKSGAQLQSFLKEVVQRNIPLLEGLIQDCTVHIGKSYAKMSVCMLTTEEGGYFDLVPSSEEMSDLRAAMRGGVEKVEVGSFAYRNLENKDYRPAIKDFLASFAK